MFQIAFPVIGNQGVVFFSRGRYPCIMEQLGQHGENRSFVLGHTRVGRPSLVAECPLHLADADNPFWEQAIGNESESWLPLPYWAFAWSGSQALARYVWDNPRVVRGLRVLDFGSGSGLSGLAAGLMGAKEVILNDIDPMAMAAAELNAELNQVVVHLESSDLLSSVVLPKVDVVLAGDVHYEEPFARRVQGWLEAWAKKGVTVLVGDPGRVYLPEMKFQIEAQYCQDASNWFEDHELCRAKVLSLESNRL
ncbi:MAG: 50S ribosomal protein L11 methyltransferase [Myxococcota bacterium]|nr:50S ribosomal protein L11 methyltransferase [Myxococcota bacterium]